VLVSAHVKKADTEDVQEQRRKHKGDGRKGKGDGRTGESNGRKGKGNGRNSGGKIKVMRASPAQDMSVPAFRVSAAPSAMLLQAPHDPSLSECVLGFAH